MQMIIKITPKYDLRDPGFALGIVVRYVRWACDIIFDHLYETETEIRQ